MKKLLAVGSVALLLGGCVAVPVDNYGYGYGYDSYGAPSYRYDSAPYPYWPYYSYYAPYYWGPPLFLAGYYGARGGHGHRWSGSGGRHWSGGHRWGGGGHR